MNYNISKKEATYLWLLEDICYVCYHKLNPGKVPYIVNSELINWAAFDELSKMKLIKMTTYKSTHAKFSELAAEVTLKGLWVAFRRNQERLPNNWTIPICSK